MSSQNGEYQFQLSLLRANFIIQGEVSSKINQYLEISSERIKEIISNLPEHFNVEKLAD